VPITDKNSKVTPIPLPNLVQIRPRRASVQVGEYNEYYFQRLRGSASPVLMVTVHWSEGSLVRKVRNGVFLNIMERNVPVSWCTHKTLSLQLWICYTLFYAAIGRAIRKFIVGQSCSSDRSAKSLWEHAREPPTVTHFMASFMSDQR